MKNFSLSVYAFHLFQTLTDAPGQKTDDACQLWENLAQLGEKELPLSNLKNLQSFLIPPEKQENQERLLHSPDSLDLGSFPTAEGFNVRGKLLPFSLHDTYAVDLTLYPEDANRSIPHTELKAFKCSSLLPSLIEPSLGETILISGEITATEQECQELASKYAIALVSDTPFTAPEFQYSGKLLEGLLFVYQSDDRQEPKNPSKQVQIFIWINHEGGTTATLAEKGYYDLLYLLCNDCKLRYVWGLSAEAYDRAKQVYHSLESQIQEQFRLDRSGDKDLDRLETWLAEMPQQALGYDRHLRDLKAHGTTIRTNRINYRTCLKNLQALGEYPPAWNDSLKTYRQWQTQIETDLNYLTPGEKLFDRLTNAVRGTVEIERTRRDRALEKRLQRLQILIAFLGTALGVSNLSIQMPGKPVETLLMQFPALSATCSETGVLSCLGYFAVYIFLHAAIGLFFAAIAISLFFLGRAIVAKLCGSYK